MLTTSNYVEKLAFEKYTEDFSNVYGTAYDAMKSGKNAAEAKLSLNVSEDALDMVSELTDDIDMSWLNNISLSMDTAIADNMQSVDLNLDIAKQTILNLNLINDLNEQEMFLALLNLSDKYILIDTEDVYGISAEELTSMYNTEEYAKILPSDKELEKLLNKYIKIVIDNLDDVEKSKETIEVDGIKEKVTVLEFNLDAETVADICTDVLEEAKKDKQLKKHIETIAAYLEEKDMIDDAGDVYAAYTEGIDELLGEIDPDDLPDGKLLTIVDYVNSKHEIVGRKIKVEKQEVLYYATAHKGKKFATELEMGGIEFTGNGTDKNGKITGEFELESYNTKIMDIAVKDFDTDKLSDGYLNGNFRIFPSSALLEETGLDYSLSSVLSFIDIGFEFDVKTSKNSSEITFNFLNEDEMFAGINLSAKTKNAGKISAPAQSKTVDIDDVDEWLESLDTDKLVSALKKAKLDNEIVELVEDALDMLEYYY